METRKFFKQVAERSCELKNAGKNRRAINDEDEAERREDVVL